MGSDRTTHTIQELIDDGMITAHKDGNYGSMYPRQSEFGDTGVLFLTAKLVSDQGFIDFENAPRLNKEKAEKLTFGYIESKDVLLSHNATVGRVALTPELTEPVLVGTSLTYFRTDRERLLPEYFAAYLSGVDFQNELKAVMGLSTRNQVPITTQRKLEVVIPPLPEQKAIAHILGTLDDKIELNRRMNATLEGMAQALFKSWFVDFDPVIDNALAAGNPIPDELAPRAEVRKNALANATTQQGSLDHPTLSDPKSLFPAAFQFNDELGPIPEGWRVGKAKDFCSKVQNGGTPNRSENSFWEGGTIPWLASGEVRQAIITETGQHITDRGFESSSAKWNPRWTTVVALYGATAGQTSLLARELTTNQAVCALIPKEDCRFYNYLNFRNRTSELEGKAVGSAQQNLSKGLVESVSQLDPRAELLAAFDSAAQPIFEKRISNLVQSQSLTKLRDTLLPKLISGELEIPSEKQLTTEAI